MSFETVSRTDLPLKNILENLDGQSAISLANASLFVNEAVHRNLSGVQGKLYWEDRCKSWRDDGMMKMALASFDSIFPKKVKRDLEERQIEFDWSDAFFAAHDIVSTIRYGKLSLSRLKSFQDRIKTDIVFQYDPEKLRFEPEIPSRFTGTSGSIVWNVLCPAGDRRHNPETVEVFDEARVCRRAVVADHENVSQSFVMILPRDELTPSLSKGDEAVVWRLLVTVGKSFVQISPLHAGDACRIPLEAYDFTFHKGRVLPVVENWKNLLAIYSDPYSLKVYRVTVDRDGGVSAGMMGKVDSRETKEFMGSLWGRIGAAADGFIFEVEEKEGSDITDQDEGLGNVVEVTVSFPWEALKYSLILQPIQALRKNDLQCFPEISTLDYDESDPVNGSASAHGLRICYTSRVFGVSRDGDHWNFRGWNEFGLNSDSEPDVTLVEIIGPNLVVVISDEILYFVQISLFNSFLNQDDKEREISGPAHGLLDLDVLRKVNLGLVEFGKQIKELHLDFDYGFPYIWLETSRVEMSEDGTFGVNDHPCSFDLYRLDFGQS